MRSEAGEIEVRVVLVQEMAESKTVEGSNETKAGKEHVFKAPERRVKTEDDLEIWEKSQVRN